MHLGLGLGVGFASSQGGPATGALSQTLGALTISATGVASFDPTGVANLVAWYEMGLGSTVVGGNLTALADQSGTGDTNKNLVFAGSGNITYTASNAAYNNKPTATFTGLQRLEAGGAWASAKTQPLTIYCVGNASANGERIFDGIASHRAAVVRDGTLWSIYAGTAFRDATGSTPGSPSKVCGVFDGASSAIYVGSDFSTAAGSGTNIGTNDITRLTLGALSGGGGNLNGTIGCVIVYSGSHNAATRALLANYLSKYGL